jgi:NADH dehydrogenase
MARIIIIGGGFAGVKCAKTLSSRIDTNKHEIVVFSSENHMVFYPLLAELASATIAPRHVAAPLRQLLRKVQNRTQEVTNIDLAQSYIEYKADDGGIGRLSYDHLVIAQGNIVNLGMIPGMADHAFPLKTVGDALVLQGHIMEQLEKAEVCDDPERKLSYLSFVVVGGGFSGVELAGEINELVIRSLPYFKNIKASDLSVSLVHSRDQVLPEVSPTLREFAKNKMEKAGIKFLLNTRASVCTPEGIGLEGGGFVKAGTVVCTIGTRALPMIDRLNVAKHQGRLQTNADMSLPGYGNTWAIGDCAAIINAIDGQYSPTTAQFAERQGTQVALNIVSRLDNGTTKPFSHKSLGSLCSIGGTDAVAEMMGIRVSGFLAWFIWRTVYLMKLPTITQKIQVAIEWTFDCLFPRPLAYLKADASKRVGSAHYSKGSFIYHPGDPSCDFYTIQEGEVELLRKNNGNNGSGSDGFETIAVLGPGDFFGEDALEQTRTRHEFARARTDLEVLVLGSNVFNQISSSLKPLKAALATTLRKRTSLWSKVPKLREVLDEIAISEIIEPIRDGTAREDNLVAELIGKMSVNNIYHCYVVDDDYKLLGLLSRSDLIQTIEMIADLPDEERPQIKAKAVMVCSPLTLKTNDNVAFALSHMREHGFKQMPVTDPEGILQGVVRLETLLTKAASKAPPRNI